MRFLTQHFSLIARICTVITIVIGNPGIARAADGDHFELRPGDRVVFIGDTLIEREQAYGYVEERLTTQYPDRDIIFRNLGWSGDTPAGISRASFDFENPGIGLQRIKERVAAVQPTVVIVGYGMASSFDGQAGLPKFKTEMNQLLDTIVALSTNGPPRFVLLSPIPHENLGAPLPDPVAHNVQLELYSRAIGEIAEARKCRFIVLDARITDGVAKPPPAETDDGIHLTGFGYQAIANVIPAVLEWGGDGWALEFGPDGRMEKNAGIKVSNVKEDRSSVRFTAVVDKLPTFASWRGTAAALVPGASCNLQIDGLKSGRYELRIDGTNILTATAKDWKRGLVIPSGPDFDQAEQLRHAIIRKNQLYFDRWRPQNETYLFGFRKNEQGRNAREIPMFDPLVAEQEKLIAKLRRPVPHTYELVPVTKEGTHPEAAPVETTASPAPSPALPLPEFDIAPGFEISLYAENPLLAKPIQMNFDPQGRLWVVSSSVYPQIEPGQIADDKVLILEDTKGTGVADKSTVFADGLMIPTGVEPGDGGVYVSQGTQLLFFKDTKGTGKADQRRVVLSGFGTEDTHHILHTLRWGPDGQLYFDQSIYIHSHIETPWGVERLNSGGIWNLRTASMQLGVFVRGFCNPWGHQFDAFGQSFITDGAGGQGLSFGIQGATYFTYASMRRELPSVSAGSYPKFCSLEIINSRQFPDDWQGNGITCDFRAHRVARFAIEEKDSAYATKEMPDLLVSTNVTFRPIDLKLGPDGALYIADWSNPIIQHGEVDFRDPRRDHEHGRIWRVTAKGRPLLKTPNFIKSTNHDLFEQLLSPNRYNQAQARRVLTERGAAIENDLAKWTKSQTAETALLQALWVYESIDVVQPALLKTMLHARDGRIRAAATRVAGNWNPRLDDSMDLLAERVADEFPRVRIEAVRALAKIPSARSAELVLSVVDKPMDTYLDYAVWLSINDLAQPWVAAVTSGEWKADGRGKQLEFALNAIEPAQAGSVLDKVVTTIPRDGKGPWIELIGHSGGEKHLRQLFEQAATGGFDDAATVRALNALDAAGSRFRGTSADAEKLAAFFNSQNAEVQTASLRLAGDWKQPAVLQKILAVVGASGTSPALAKAGLESIRQIGGRQLVPELPRLIRTSRDESVRREAALVFAALDLDTAVPTVISLLSDIKSADEAAEFWHSLLGVKGMAGALAKSLPKSGLSPVMAKAGLRVARGDGRNEPDLVVALTRGADLEAEGLGLTDAEMKQIGVRAAREGDPARGEMIFRRKEMACTTCHAIGGVGGHVGPDLTSIGASAQIDYLIESVFYPNRKIKEGYHSVLLETTDGLELSGIISREDGEQVVLRDATDKEIRIPKGSIKSRALGNSLMPAGLVDSLNTAQQMDLFRFLSELGKPGPYDASKGNVARLWRLLPQTVDNGQFGDEHILATKLTDSDWTKTPSLVDGRLPRAELQAGLDSAGSRALGALFAATQMQAAAGPVHLRLTGAPESPLWIDGKPAKPDAAPDLAAGVHTVIVKLDKKHLPESIKLESADATFLVN